VLTVWLSVLRGSGHLLVVQYVSACAYARSGGVWLLLSWRKLGDCGCIYSTMRSLLIQRCSLRCNLDPPFTSFLTLIRRAFMTFQLLSRAVALAYAINCLASFFKASGAHLSKIQTREVAATASRESLVRMFNVRRKEFTFR
jgi:hypothetical protein